MLSGTYAWQMVAFIEHSLFSKRKQIPQRCEEEDKAFPVLNNVSIYLLVIQNTFLINLETTTKQYTKNAN